MANETKKLREAIIALNEQRIIKALEEIKKQQKKIAEGK